MTLEALRGRGFWVIFIVVGAEWAKMLGLPGEDAHMDPTGGDLPAWG